MALVGVRWLLVQWTVEARGLLVGGPDKNRGFLVEGHHTNIIQNIELALRPPALPNISQYQAFLGTEISVCPGI